MRRRRILIAVAAIAVIAAGCDYPNLAPPGDSPVRYRDDVFSTIQTTTNITYGTATNLSGQVKTLTLDLYRPPAADTVTKRPAIVWVHGGSFSGGDKSSGELVDQATVFARKGFVNVSINYRLEPGGCSASAPTENCVKAIIEAREDAQTAVLWLKSHATTYGVDPTRIAIGGSSAGAITAANVAYSTGETPAAGVRAAMSLSGASITSTISAGDAPVLLFHGTNDRVVPYQWAVDTVNSARALHLDVFLTTWTGAGHVPYGQFRDQILTQTRNFLWWEMDLANAAH
jgi:para-nitrobenzyl esterase